MSLKFKLCVFITTLMICSIALAAPPPGKGGGGSKNKASLSVLIDPTSFSEAGGTATGIVSRENSDLSVPLTVTLSSDITGEVTFPGTVEIPVNEASETFNITAVDDTEKDGDQTVTISVSATNHSGASASITVIDDEGMPQVEYVLSTVELPPGTNGAWTNDLTDSGIAVGWYFTATSGRRAWLYDPANPDHPNSAIDLNNLLITGVPPGWIIASAVGANNNGLVVGYLESLPDRNERKGFVLDLLTLELFELPDSGYGWTRPAGADVNDRGDIMGVYTSGTDQGFFLVNPGLRGEEFAFEIEIPGILVSSTDQVTMSNPWDDSPAEVVAPLSEGGIVVYSQGGGEVTYSDPNFDITVAINDDGDIAAETVVYEYAAKGNKTRIVSESHELFRVIDDVEETIPLSDSFGFYISEINNDHTVLIEGLGYSGMSLYHDQYKLISVASLTSLVELPALGIPRMNNVGVDGFSKIAAVGGYETEGRYLVIFTPYFLTP